MDFILDVDGVLTDGSFLYSKEGKIYKKFGPHDAYSLKKLSKVINISFISADSRGFEITKKRINDMGFEVKLVSEEERYEYIVKNYNLESLIYMGDGDADARLLKESFKGIAPNNARPLALKSAELVTNNVGASGAEAEASDLIVDNLIN